jgi:FtsH-binding integral membrane protein
MTNASRQRMPAAPVDAASRAVRKARLTIRLRYATTGAILGVVWVISSGQPLVTHLVRSFIVAVVMVLLLELLRRRPKRRQNRAGATSALSLAALIGAKLALLLIAAAAELALEHGNVAYPDAIVAVGLFVAVAVAGPLAHRFFERPASPA